MSPEGGGPGTSRPLLGGAEVGRLLEAHGLAPTKRLGQNFVVDPNTVRKTVRDAGVAPGDLVLEVGPGLGSLTLALREAGASVVALEVDAGMVRALTDVIGADEGVTIVHGDALREDLGALVDAAVQRDAAAQPDRGAVRLVANLPYNVGVPIVLRALATGRFETLHVMVQREAGERMAAGAGDRLYGAVSVKVAAWAHARVAATVPRTAFRPVPNVDSVTVTLQPRPWTHTVGRAVLARWVDRGFAQRRKRLRNALSSGDGPAPIVVERALQAIGRDPGARAEELDLTAWTALASELERGGG